MCVHPLGDLGGDAGAGFRVQEIRRTHLYSRGTGHDELQRIAAGQDAAQPHHGDADSTHSLPHHAQGDGPHRRAGQAREGVVEHRAALFQINGAGLEGIAQADGIGTAPLLLLCKQLCRAGVRPDVYVGFRDTSYGMDKFVPWCHDVFVATDSGNEGHHGLVTDLLDAKNYDIVLTCGPMVMMRGVAKLCAAANVPCLASLEKKMACGLGACLGCTCHTKIGPVTVCKDGPVFNAQEVFD